jgi:hypothetical protein
MDELDHHGWVVHRSYDVGGVGFGVRTNSEACGAWLDDTFGEYGIDDEVDPYYSILIGEDGNRRVRQRFHLLFEESRTIARTRDTHLLGRAVLAQFEQLQAVERSDAVYAEASLVRLGDVVALLPSDLVTYVELLSHRVIERSGLLLPAVNYVAIDPDTGHALPLRPTLAVPVDAVERIAAVAPASRREERMVVEQPLEVDIVCSTGLLEEPVTQTSPGLAAYRLATRALNLRKMGGRGLEGLTRLSEKARCLEIKWGSRRETLEALTEALRSA